MSTPPHEVYSRYLAGTHGYPLWTPQLKVELPEDYQLEGLKIGDVGIISPINGSFDVLFNITLPREEQPFPELVQEGFTPITLSRQRDLDTQPDAVSPTQGVFPRGSVQLISAQVHSCDQKPSRANYQLSLSAADGAVLILPEGAESCDLKNEKTFLGEAIRHGVDWYECATETAGRLINNDSLYLITGFHKARSWSLGATDGSSSNLQDRRSLTFEVGQIHKDSVTAQAYRWAIVQGFMGRVGPESPYKIPNYVTNEMRRGVNQTIFIRGFRIMVNKILFLKTVSVETRQGTFGGLGAYVNNVLWGRTSESTPSSGAKDATDNTVEQDSSVNHGQLYMDTRMTIDRVPNVSQTFHPGDSINQYLLKKEPRAMIALTHDSLWIDMLQLGLLELGDFSREIRLEQVLLANYRIIVEDGKCCAVYLGKGPADSASPSSALVVYTQAPNISDPKRGGQEPLKEETLAHGDPPQKTPSFSSSAARRDEGDVTIITSIRATDVTLGIRRVPAGFYIVVRHSGLEWRTASKQPSVDGDIEWNGPIPIPSDLSATVRLEVYASFEPQPMLGAGEQLRELSVTVEQLLECKEKDISFTFFPKDRNVTSRTVKRQKSESNLSTSTVLFPAQTAADVPSLHSPESDIHPDLTWITPESVPLPSSKTSSTTSSASLDLASEHLEPTSTSSPVGPSEHSTSLPLTVELQRPTLSSGEPSELVMNDLPENEGNLSYPAPSARLQLQMPHTHSLQVQDGRETSLETSFTRSSDSRLTSFESLAATTEKITPSEASIPLLPPYPVPLIQSVSSSPSGSTPHSPTSMASPPLPPTLSVDASISGRSSRISLAEGDVLPLADIPGPHFLPGAPYDERALQSPSSTSGLRSPLPTPGRATALIQPSSRHTLRSPTLIQVPYHPPLSPGVGVPVVPYAVLKHELARTRAMLDKERQLRATKANEARVASTERDEASRNQQADHTNMTRPKKSLREKQALIEEYRAEKQLWKEERDGQIQELMGMVSQILDEQAGARQREEEQRRANEGIEHTVELLTGLLDSWRADSARQHQETIDVVRKSANEQVPFNVQGYLDEFSKALATEVRVLLGEVGKLREERRNIQHELGFLMLMKSKYGPGGEFDPGWKPPMASGVPPPPPPPPDIPLPPEDFPSTRPSWRTVPRRVSRRSQKRREVTPPEPAPEPRSVHSWATWQPNPGLAPTPPPVEPVLLVPDYESPKLFGPRSPTDSDCSPP